MPNEALIPTSVSLVQSQRPFYRIRHSCRVQVDYQGASEDPVFSPDEVHVVERSLRAIQARSMLPPLRSFLPLLPKPDLLHQC